MEKLSADQVRDLVVAELAKHGVDAKGARGDYAGGRYEVTWGRSILGFPLSGTIEETRAAVVEAAAWHAQHVRRMDRMDADRVERERLAAGAAYPGKVPSA